MNTNTAGAEALNAKEYPNPNEGIWVGDGSATAKLNISDSGNLEIEVFSSRDAVYVTPKDMLTALAKLGIMDDGVELRRRVEDVIRPFETSGNFGSWPIKEAAVLVPKIREALNTGKDIVLPKGLGAVIEGTMRDANLPVRLVLNNGCWMGGKHPWSQSKIRSLLRDIKVLSEGVL